jgi:hypothetical protein
VYAIEQMDLPPDTILEDVALDLAGTVRTGPSDPASAIPVSLIALGQVRKSAPVPLYRTVGTDDPAAPESITLTAVPYFLWGNRRPGPMRVWIPVAVPVQFPLRQPGEA